MDLTTPTQIVILINAIWLILNLILLYLVTSKKSKNDLTHKSKYWTGDDTSKVNMIQKIMSDKDQQEMSDIIARNRAESLRHRNRNNHPKPYDPLTDPATHIVAASIAESYHRSSSYGRSDSSSSYDSSSSSSSSSSCGGSSGGGD